MLIYADDTASMVSICAALTREGMMFEAHPNPAQADGWTITLTGGY